MTDTFRALCAELVDAWLKGDDIVGAMNRARAALGEADEPAVPESREPASVVGEPSDEELLELWQGWNLGWDPQKGMVLMPHPAEYARAVLARWGHQPAPPAEGEVAEVAAWLRAYRDEEFGPLSDDPDARWITRAADLLEHQAAPVPVPVSERLPGPEDMTDDGEVWIEDPGQEYPLADAGDYDWEPHKWILRPIGKFDAQNGLRWLPAHALPLPEVGS